MILVAIRFSAIPSEDEDEDMALSTISFADVDAIFDNQVLRIIINSTA